MICDCMIVQIAMYFIEFLVKVGKLLSYLSFCTGLLMQSALAITSNAPSNALR